MGLLTVKHPVKPGILNEDLLRETMVYACARLNYAAARLWHAILLALHFKCESGPDCLKPKEVRS